MNKTFMNTTNKSNPSKKRVNRLNLFKRYIEMYFYDNNKNDVAISNINKDVAIVGNPTKALRK